MLTLRLTQQLENLPDSYRVDVTLDDNEKSQNATVYFKLNINEQDQEKIRWYLEDFLELTALSIPNLSFCYTLMPEVAKPPRWLSLGAGMR